MSRRNQKPPPRTHSRETGSDSRENSRLPKKLAGTIAILALSACNYLPGNGDNSDENIPEKPTVTASETVTSEAPTETETHDHSTSDQFTLDQKVEQINDHYRQAAVCNPHELPRLLDDPSNITPDFARQCQERLQGSGNLAVVYDKTLTGAEIELIVKEAERILNHASGGLITLDITPFAASPDTIEALEVINPEQCFAPSNVQYSLARAEDALNPELATYDMVAALTDRPRCIDDGELADIAQGVAYKENGMRYSEVGNVKVNGSVAEAAALVLAHEAGHQLGLGHSSELFSSGLGGQFHNMIYNSGKPLNINLIEYLGRQDTFHNEYGVSQEAGMMGSTDVVWDETMQLAGPYMALLEMPLTRIGHKPTVEVEDLAKSSVELTIGESTRKLAAIQLRDGLQLPESLVHSTSGHEIYDMITLDPKLIDGELHVQVYIAGSQYNNLVSLGSVFGDGEHVIDVGEGEVVVMIDSGIAMAHFGPAA